MRYKVRITPTAEDSIREQARYIAIDQLSPLNASRWLEAILTAAQDLEQWPRRHPEAEESAHRPYEIRKLSIKGFLLLYTIDENTRTVWIIATRHGRQLPRAENLPG